LKPPCPYLEGISDTGITDQSGRSDYLFREEQAHGLGAAYLLDGVAISIRSSVPWYGPTIEIGVRTLSPDAENIDESTAIIRHVSVITHVLSHAADIENEQIAQIYSGEELWKSCSTLFSNIDFCPRVEADMKALTAGTGGLGVVRRALREMQMMCSSWNGSKFDAKLLSNTTPESKATLDQFGDERTFERPDGEYEQFSWHMKLGAYRIYFSPNPENKTCLVGYIGRHLQTVRFR
jgi:hypothetical protein